MATLKQIKQAQIAAATEAGEPSPYDAAKEPVSTANKEVTAVDAAATAPRGKLGALKAKQLKANAEAYTATKGFFGVDMASGTDSSTYVLSGASKSVLEQLQAAMATDIARLKTKPVLEEKQALKRELIPNYLPFVEAYETSGHNYPNDVAVQVVVWLFDIEDIELGLRFGRYLVGTGSNDLPKTFARNLPTFMADTVYDWANAQLKANQTASPYLDNLVELIDSDEFIEAWDMHPLVVSKSLSMLAKHKAREAKFGECVKLCERAETVNPQGAGVKTLKEGALKALEKLKAEEQSNT